MHFQPMMMMMMRNGMPPHQFRHKRQMRKKNQNPADFNDIYKNPLTSFTYLYQKIIGTYKSQQSRDYQHEDQYPFRDDQAEYYNRYERRYHGGYDDLQQNFFRLLKMPYSENIKSVCRQINQCFDQNSKHMIENRKECIQVLKKVDAPHDKVNQLEKQNLNEKWGSLRTILQQKIDKVMEQYQEKRNIFVETKQIKQSIQKLKVTQYDPKTLRAVIAFFLSSPTRDTYLQQITKLLKLTRETLTRYLSKDNEIISEIQLLPYKESSYYWESIISCVSQISTSHHYNNIDSQKIIFQAEYVGEIRTQTLKTCAEGEWIQNKITSAIIEYLKHIQGANNYHEDGNKNAYIFNHSETNIFIKDQRQQRQNYLDYDKLIFLINANSTHWLVMVVYTSTKDLVIYDSLGGYEDVYSTYTKDIEAKLKKESSRRRLASFALRITKVFQPKQRNTFDCGVFAIINIICAFDKQKSVFQNKQKESALQNTYSSMIINHIRHSLYLFMLYLGYAKLSGTVPRKDYFTFLFRSTIYSDAYSKLHLMSLQRTNFRKK